MIHLYDGLMLGGVFCSFICSIILFGIKRPIYSNRILSVILFLTAWHILLFLLVLLNLISQFPYAFKVTGHFYFLVPPLSYIYIRSIIYEEKKFRKTDWLHFVLAGLIFFDYIPYLFASSTDAGKLANAVVLDMKTSYRANATFISPYWYYHIRFFQGVAYIVFQWVLIAKYTVFKRTFFRANRSVLIWLIFFMILSSLLFTGLQTRNISYLIGINIKDQLIAIGTISVCFFGLSTYLFFFPELLYGSYYNNAGTIQDVLHSNKTDDGDFDGLETMIEDKVAVFKKLITPEQLPLDAQRVERYIKESGAFRRPGICIHDLATELEIPVRNLSYILNHFYHLRFNDFINNYRINYIIQRFESDDWKNLTFEGLAKEAGFSSRSTFFTVFKKLKGVTPSEYINSKISSQPQNDSYKEGAM